MKDNGGITKCMGRESTLSRLINNLLKVYGLTGRNPENIYSHIPWENKNIFITKKASLSRK